MGEFAFAHSRDHRAGVDVPAQALALMSYKLLKQFSMKTSTLYSVIIQIVICTGDESDETDYSQQGANWDGLCATGKRQSPM